MPGSRNIAQLLDLGERVLQDSTHIFEDHDNRQEAEELLAFTLDVDLEEEDLDLDGDVTQRQQERYLSMVARRAGGEPFPFIVGRIEFYGLDLKVWPGAFVPRPSSELTVDRAVKRIGRKRSPVVVDVCSGAGPIALGIADEVKSAQVWGLDIQEEGLEQGRKNARRLAIRNVHFRRGDMYEPLPEKLRGKVDAITGHVPYVPTGELEDLPSEVREHEPIFTLSDESEDGLGLMRKAVEGAVDWLAPGGWLLLEMSDDLSETVREMCRGVGLEDHGHASDEDGLSIVVEARKGTSQRG